MSSAYNSQLFFEEKKENMVFVKTLEEASRIASDYVTEGMRYTVQCTCEYVPELHECVQGWVIAVAASLVAVL